jgi:hypothetical protein
MAKEVCALRRFRDNQLRNNVLGRKFVELYYKYSPPIADYIRDKPLMRAAVRAVLKPLVWVANKAE